MSPSSVSSRSTKRSTQPARGPVKRVATASARPKGRGRTFPLPPTYLRRYGLILALALVFVGFLLVVGSARALRTATSAAKTTADDAASRQFLHATAYLTNTQNILILGSDKRTDETMWRTDVIMLAAIDRTSGRAAVISLPRDLYVDIPNYGPGRINTADFIGSTEGQSPQALSLIHI